MADRVNAGCNCAVLSKRGMAGAFGFEKEHYVISVQCGERVLLPAVRSADRNILIVADGFSCREQIAQLTTRTAIHTAQLLQQALRKSDERPRSQIHLGATNGAAPPIANRNSQISGAGSN